MNSDVQRELLEEAAQALRNIEHWRGVLCNAATHTDDPVSLQWLATMEEKAMRCQATLRLSIDVLVREDQREEKRNT